MGAFRDEALRFSLDRCERELDDPAEVDIPDACTQTAYRVAFTHFDAYFAKAYAVARLGDRDDNEPTTPHRDRAAAGSLIGQASPLSDSSEEGDSGLQMTTRERRECLTVMAGVTAWSARGVIRLTNVLGRECQSQALRFLDEVIPTLQKGLGLQRVEREVVESSARALEPDAAIVAKRLALRNRKRDLLELR